MSNTLRMKDIPLDRLTALEQGVAETRVLTEGLAIDFAALMRATQPHLPPQAFKAMAQGSSLGITRRMALAGQLLLENPSVSSDVEHTISALQNHASDTVRGWACYVISAIPATPLPLRLAQIQPLADDLHFGVREWAWLAIRPHLAKELPEALRLLTPWAHHPHERIRRFACEALRPRGVWCAHLQALKTDPAQALDLLQALYADPSRYVQDSVSNWLNDAAKDQPGWVQTLCAQWLQGSPSAATQRICRRAVRSIKI
jgi:3-methyladenine DNA glycosylase AlkC